MERCPKCGNRLSHIDVLCPRCGALVEVIQVNKNFLPSTSGESISSRGSERPSLIVYNEDFPDEGLFTDTDQKDDAPDTMPEIPTAPDESFAGILNVPDFDLPGLSSIEKPELDQTGSEAPLLEQTGSEAPLLEQTGSEEPLLEQNGSEKPLLEQTRTKEPLLRQAPKEDPLPESRMARRARERQFEEATARASSAEDKLLSEAEALTAGAGNYQRIEDSDVGMPSDAMYQSEGARRYRARQHDAVKKTKKTERRKLPAPAVIVLWAMAAAAIFLGFFYLNRYVQSNHGSYAAFVRQITNGKVELDTGQTFSQDVSVSTVVFETANGEPAHTFTVTAPGAVSIRVLPTGDVFEIRDGKAAFTLSDEDMARALGVISYDASFITDGLSLDISYSSTTRNYPVEFFELFLLASEYSRKTPAAAQSSSDETAAISMRVAPGSTVFINNENLSAKVDDDGLLSVEMALDPGENYFAVDVIQPGRQAVKDQFTVTRQLAQTKLEPESDYLRVHSDSFEARGTTDPGASLSAVLDSQTFAGLVSENGAFSVACELKGYGLHMIMLKATSDNREETERTVAVERIPEPGELKKNAREMNAATIIKDAGKLSGVGIKLVSSIKNLETDSHVQRFSVSSGSNSLSCYYHGPDKLSAESSYTLYGMVDEKTDEFYVILVE